MKKFAFVVALALTAPAFISGAHAEDKAKTAASPRADRPKFKDVKKLEKKDLKKGKGATAEKGKAVSVHYTGWLTDGKVFDTSLDRGEPFKFQLGAGQVIKGWDEGVEGMKEGGKRLLTIPSDMAYGDRGVGPIPPKSTLRFEVELLKVE